MQQKPTIDTFRKNENKDWREEWVAKKFSDIYLASTPFEISSAESKNDSVDIYLKIREKDIPFQIVEFARRSEENKEIFGEYEHMPYGSLKKEVLLAVKRILDKKDKKQYSDVSDLSLLIYLNPRCILCPEDFDETSLKEVAEKSKFGNVFVYTDGGVYSLKETVNFLS